MKVVEVEVEHDEEEMAMSSDEETTEGLKGLGE